ncbi:TATA-binding protein-associated phosphoprotein [Entamoeba marina]
MESKFPKQQKLTSVQQKQLSKSIEAYQQAVLIYLLTKKDYTIHLKKLDKKAKKTAQNYPIVSLSHKPSNTTINFQKNVEEVALQYYNREIALNPTSEQLKRHFDRNKVTIACNNLLEFIQTLGFVVEQRGTRSTKMTVKLNKISKITGNGVTIEKNDILTLGKRDEVVVNHDLVTFIDGVGGVDLNCSSEKDVINNNEKIDVASSNQQNETHIEQRFEPELHAPQITNREESVDELKAKMHEDNKDVNGLSVFKTKNINEVGEVFDDFDLGVLPEEFVVKQTDESSTINFQGSYVHSYDPMFSFYSPNDINSKWLKK